MSSSTGTVIITGANGGLGSAFVEQFLASKHATENKLLCTVRNPSKVPELEKIISKNRPEAQEASLEALDLSSLSAVRAFAAVINRRVAEGSLAPIRALVLNAALQDNNGQNYTKDGIERVFAVDYLANFLLVLLLLQSFDKQNGRIVTVSSYTHDPAVKLNSPFNMPAELYSGFDNLVKPVPDKKGDEHGSGMRRYGASKLAMLMFMNELQRRLEEDPKLKNISFLAVDPGGMAQTSMIKNAPYFQQIIIYYVLGYVVTPILGFFNSKNPILRTTTKSAKDLMYAAFDTQELGSLPKGVTLDGCVPNVTNPESRDSKKLTELWKGSLELVGLKSSETVLSL